MHFFATALALPSSSYSDLDIKELCKLLREQKMRAPEIILKALSF